MTADVVPSVDEFVQATAEDGVYRPVVDIVLRLGDTSQTLRALVDSGADLTVVPTEVAEAMLDQTFPEIEGIETTMRGVCGEVPAKIVAAAATFMGRQFAQQVMVGPTPRTLVGRIDFMAVFNARFYWNRTPPEFNIEPADTPTAARPRLATDPTIRPNRKNRRR